ncbi:MAG: hypothetical protein AB7H43_09380 [Acidimicrobiia bacterium]
MRLLGVEIRRSLHRRVVWTLVLLALALCGTTGVIAFATSGATTPAELAEEVHPAAMATWSDLAGDGALTIAALFLLLGGLFGGASVAGAEWRAGTITTLLTWEPRRARAHLARLGACAACAAGIAWLLQVVYLSSLLPAVLAHGTADGVDGAWWTGLALATLRVSVLTAAAAVLGASLATVGRNTAFGVMAVFGWLTVGEGLLRGLRPSITPHLLAENIGTVLTWARLDAGTASRTPVVAAAALGTYATVVVLAGLAGFVRRDVAAAT